MTGDQPSASDVTAVIDAHQRSGYRLDVGGVATFVLDQGHGEPVVCMHGVPASSFLYRKLVVELASRGLRGIAFDLPGLGLAERPAAFDYTWSGLGRFASAAVEALSVDRFHLVVHDIGAPVGFELAAADPRRVASLTVLNAPVEVDSFHRPLVMKPFAVMGLGEVYLRLLNPPTFRWLMRRQGVADLGKITTAEIDAYLVLLRRADKGRAFLKIMRGFELTRAKRDLYVHLLRSRAFPVQIIWGEADPALKVNTFGEIARRAAGVEHIHRLPGKHFLQEDQSPALAELIIAQARA
jgi:haloalkane dehalogenase